MKKMILIVMIVGFTCQARIGETRVECHKRYGKPFKIIDANMEVFRFKNLIVAIKYIDEKCQILLYKKQEVDVLDRPKKLSDNEIKLMLKANSSKEWILTEKGFLTKTLTTEDGLTAIYGSKHNLTIVTQIAEDKHNKDKKDKEQKALEGL